MKEADYIRVHRLTTLRIIDRLIRDIFPNSPVSRQTTMRNMLIDVGNYIEEDQKENTRA